MRAQAIDPALNLAAAVMDVVEDLAAGREIRIIRDQGGRVHVTAPDGRLASALRAAFEAEGHKLLEVSR